jgi:hypothetical protein
MKRVLRITLVTGEVDELDLTTYMLQAKVPLGASAIDPAYIMITKDIATHGFLAKPEGSKHPKWIAPSLIKCIEIVFDLN